MPAPFLVSYILQLVNVTFGHLWHEDRIKPMPETKTLLEERHGTHFVSSTLGLLLKEHGFNKPCSNFLDIEMMYEWKSAFPINHNLNAKEISQPTNYQVIEWLRETNSIYLSILPSLEDEVSFDLMLVDVAMKEKLTKHINSNNYNSAIEECIVWALENISINNQ